MNISYCRRRRKGLRIWAIHGALILGIVQQLVYAHKQNSRFDPKNQEPNRTLTEGMDATPLSNGQMMDNLMLALQIEDLATIANTVHLRGNVPIGPREVLVISLA